MTYKSSNSEEIESLDTPELVRRVRDAMKQGCVHPCHVFDMVDEALQRLVFLTDGIADLRHDNQDLRKGMVAKCHCRHFRGLHENEYADCIVVCEKHDDDYVSMASCQCCPDFALEEGT